MLVFDLVWIKSHPALTLLIQRWKNSRASKSLIAFARCWWATIDVEQIASREDCDIHRVNVTASLWRSEFKVTSANCRCRPTMQASSHLTD